MPKSPTSSDLISPEYLAEQKRLHADPRGYGGRGSKWADVVCGLVAARGYASVLDYGCGQATLGDVVQARMGEDRVMWRNYDPAVKRWAHMPSPRQFDLVVCTDVMEHLEIDRIPAVLGHLRSLVREGGYLFAVVSTVPTAKLLSDGRQAHITLENQEWWSARLRDAGFTGDNTWTIPNPKPEKQFACVYRPA